MLALPASLGIQAVLAAASGGPTQIWEVGICERGGSIGRLSQELLGMVMCLFFHPQRYSEGHPPKD